MTTNPVDYLKYVAAEAGSLIESAQQAICALGHSDDDRVEAILSQLDAVRHIAIEAAAVFCRHDRDLDHYADGRPVRTRLDLEVGNYYEHRWHPDHGHRVNQPHEIATVKTTSGQRKRLIVTAPGLLGAADALRVVE